MGWLGELHRSGDRFFYLGHPRFWDEKKQAEWSRSETGRPISGQRGMEQVKISRPLSLAASNPCGGRAIPKVLARGDLRGGALVHPRILSQLQARPSHCLSRLPLSGLFDLVEEACPPCPSRLPGTPIRITTKTVPILAIHVHASVAALPALRTRVAKQLTCSKTKLRWSTMPTPHWGCTNQA